MFQGCNSKSHAKTMCLYINNKIEYETCNGIIYNSIKTFPIHENKIYKKCTIPLHKTLIGIMREIKENLNTQRICHYRYWKNLSYKDVISKSINSMQ